MNNVALYTVNNVGLAAITNALYTRQNRVAVSLPRPDHYATYTGINGLGSSLSKIGTRPDDSDGVSTPYTTWMVLYYYVSSVANPVLTQATFSGTSTPPTLGSPSSLSLANNSLSIVMGDPNPGDGDPGCDSISALSFSAAKALWEYPPIYALFPQENFDDSQTTTYLPTCPVASVMEDAMKFQNEYAKARTGYAEILNRLQSLKENLGQVAAIKENRSGAKTPSFEKNWVKERQGELSYIREGLKKLGYFPTAAKVLNCADELILWTQNTNAHLTSCPGGIVPPEYVIKDYLFEEIGIGVTLTAVGGGDCHKAQMNINGAVQ